jgi:hypothetical protein
MTTSKVKIKGQATEIDLNSHARGHLDTFVDYNQVVAKLHILKLQGTPNVSIKIDDRNGLSEDQLDELSRRFRHLASATLVHQHGYEEWAFELNSGHRFIDGFLLELVAVLAGRRGWGDTFNPKLHSIKVVDDQDNPVHETIDKLARNRVWAVYIGNTDGYDSTVEIMSAHGADTTEESAIHAMELVELVADRLPYGGVRVEFRDKEVARVHSHFDADDSFVLIEITDEIDQQHKTSNKNGSARKWIVVFENGPGNPDLENILDHASGSDMNIYQATHAMNLRPIHETGPKRCVVGFVDPQRHQIMERKHHRLTGQWPVLIEDPR